MQTIMVGNNIRPPDFEVVISVTSGRLDFTGDTIFYSHDVNDPGNLQTPSQEVPYTLTHRHIVISSSAPSTVSTRTRKETIQIQSQRGGV